MCSGSRKPNLVICSCAFYVLVLSHQWTLVPVTSACVLSILCILISALFISNKEHLYTQTALLLHSHGEHWDFSSDQCDYASYYASNLKSHLKTHCGERSNKCNQCDFASSRADHLRRHLKAHSGEKPHKCNICNYASNQAGNLKKHLKIHGEMGTSKGKNNLYLKSSK